MEDGTWLNIPAIVVTEETFPSPIGWLKLDALLKHFIHIRHIADIPSRDVIVKGCLVLEGLDIFVTPVTFQSLIWP